MFLYHSLLKNGLNASKLHTEVYDKKKQKCDIVLGKNKVFIEIKYSKSKNTENPSERLKKYLKKLKKYSGNRKAVFILFVDTKKNKRIEGDNRIKKIKEQGSQ